MQKICLTTMCYIVNSKRVLLMFTIKANLPVIYSHEFNIFEQKLELYERVS